MSSFLGERMARCIQRVYSNDSAINSLSRWMDTGSICTYVYISVYICVCTYVVVRVSEYRVTSICIFIALIHTINLRTLSIRPY